MPNYMWCLHYCYGYDRYCTHYEKGTLEEKCLHRKAISYLSDSNHLLETEELTVLIEKIYTKNVKGETDE